MSGILGEAIVCDRGPISCGIRAPSSGSLKEMGRAGWAALRNSCKTKPHCSPAPTSRTDTHPSLCLTHVLRADSHVAQNLSLPWNTAVASRAPQPGHFMRRVLCDLDLMVACLAMLPRVSEPAHSFRSPRFAVTLVFLWTGLG